MKRTAARMIRGLLLSCVVCGAATAETIVVNDGIAVRESTVQRPTRGISMSEVEAQFGAPREKHAAVGQPPIARWDYDGFVVFFENDRVIHAVALR
jgi:hypothetical protein